MRPKWEKDKEGEVAVRIKETGKGVGMDTPYRKSWKTPRRRKTAVGIEKGDGEGGWI